MDKLCDMGPGIVEAKCPFNPPTAVKLDHICQVQYQMWVRGAAWADYICYNRDWTQKEPLIWRILFSEEWMAWMFPRVKYFLDCAEKDVEPDLPYIKPYCMEVKDAYYEQTKSEMLRLFGDFLPPMGAITMFRLN